MHNSANHFDLIQFNAKCVSNPKRDSPQEMSIITLKGPPNIPKLKANSYILHTYILKKGLLSKTALDYIFLVSCYYLSEIKVIIIITPPGWWMHFYIHDLATWFHCQDRLYDLNNYFWENNRAKKKNWFWEIYFWNKIFMTLTYEGYY